MSKIKVISGNFYDILKDDFPLKFYKDAIKAQSYFKHMDQILLDLERALFVPTKNYTIDNLIATWTSDTVTRQYLQGNMEGAIAIMFLQNSIFKDPNLEKNQEDYLGNMAALRLSYYNDEGTPCGVTIAYCKNDPSIWVASSVQNSTGGPEERMFTIIANENMLVGGKLTKKSTAVDLFLKSLNSKIIANWLKGKASFEDDRLQFTKNGIKLYPEIFLKNGNVAVQQLAKLNDQVQHCTSDQAEKINQMRRKVEKIKKEQEEKIRKLEGIDKYNKEFTEIAEKYDAEESKVTIDIVSKISSLEKKERATKFLSVDPNLEKAGKQSFMRRNSLKLMALSLAIVGLVSIGLILSGILAPFGLALAASLLTYLATGGAMLAGLALGASTVKLYSDERNLFAYQQRLPTVKALFKEKERALEASLSEKTLQLNVDKEEELEKLRKSDIGVQISQIEAQYQKKSNEIIAAYTSNPDRSFISDTLSQSTTDSSSSSSSEEPLTVTKKQHSAPLSRSFSSLFFSDFDQNKKEKKSAEREDPTKSL